MSPKKYFSSDSATPSSKISKFRLKSKISKISKFLKISKISKIFNWIFHEALSTFALRGAIRPRQCRTLLWFSSVSERPSGRRYQQLCKRISSDGDATVRSRWNPKFLVCDPRPRRSNRSSTPAWGRGENRRSPNEEISRNNLKISLKMVSLPKYSY